jgi:arylsulfatase A-like enzyme
MFTGRWANDLTQQSRRGAEWYRALDPRNPVLADVLARSGYRTAGFVGNLVFTSRETGLARGFETYEDYEVSIPQILLSSALGRRLAGNDLLRRALRYQEVLNRKDARTVTDQFLEWHRENGDRPFFAFLNFFDAHEPHVPPDSVKRAMPPGSRWNDFSHFVGLLTGATALRNRKWEMDRAERAAHASGYHDAILRMDIEVGRMMEELERRGALENTIIIITSDHGEQLGEHGLYNHNNSLYLPVLYVPLLVLDPISDPDPMEIRAVVNLRNVAATILDLVGVDRASTGIQGTSLARYWRSPRTGAPGTSSEAGEPSFAVLYRGAENETWYPLERGPVMFSVTDSSFHYILGGDGNEELFDLKSDPGELANLVGRIEADSVLAGFRTTLRALAPESDSFRSPADRH